MSVREMEGVRVVELGQWLNVGYAGKLLADLGAEVIRVESPDADDQVRLFGPFPGDEPDPETSGLHVFLNSNKRSVTLHPSALQGRELFKALCQWADVLIEGTEAGYLAQAGLGHEVLRELNPRLVAVSLSSLGRTGPYASYKGNDLLSWHGSATGHIYLGDEHREPVRGAWYHASHWGAFMAAGAATMGLLSRERTGRGQWVDISESEALGQLFLGVEVSDFFGFDTTRTRYEWGLRNHAPRIFNRCKDGWVAMMTVAQHQWEALVKAMGSPEWADPGLFAGTSLDRHVYIDEITDLMGDWLMSHTAREVFELCQAELVPAAPINTVQDIYDDAHLQAREFFLEMEHPVAGKVRLPGPPYRISGDPWRVDRPAPLLGQHNEEVYVGLLGRPKEDLADLRRAGVI